MTLEEYLATPETALPAELFYGELRIAADAPLPHHQRAVAAFFRALDAHVRAAGLGEVWLSPLDVILDADRHLVVQPDLLFVSAARSHIVEDRLRGAPDMVLEVLSPRPRVGQVAARVKCYAGYGVRECWIFHQRHLRLEILGFADGEIVTSTMVSPADRIQSAVFPELNLALGEVVDSYQ